MYKNISYIHIPMVYKVFFNISYFYTTKRTQQLPQPVNFCFAPKKGTYLRIFFKQYRTFLEMLSYNLNVIIVSAWCLRYLRFKIIYAFFSLIFFLSISFDIRIIDIIFISQIILVFLLTMTWFFSLNDGLFQLYFSLLFNIKWAILYKNISFIPVCWRHSPKARLYLCLLNTEIVITI